MFFLVLKKIIQVFHHGVYAPLHIHGDRLGRVRIWPSIKALRFSEKADKWFSLLCTQFSLLSTLLALHLFARKPSFWNASAWKCTDYSTETSVQSSASWRANLSTSLPELHLLVLFAAYVCLQDGQWGLCALRHGVQISMEAILACHPARSTEWLDCHPKSCERWRIRTGPIDPMHEAWHGNFSRNDRFVPFSDVGNNPICPQNGVLTICGETKFPAMHVYDPFEIPTQRTSLGGAQFLFLSRVTWAAVDCMPCCCMKLSACESMKPGMHSVWTCCHKDRARNRFFFRREVLVFSLHHWPSFRASMPR